VRRTCIWGMAVIGEPSKNNEKRPLRPGDGAEKHRGKMGCGDRRALGKRRTKQTGLCPEKKESKKAWLETQAPDIGGGGWGLVCVWTNMNKGGGVKGRGKQENEWPQEVGPS